MKKIFALSIMGILATAAANADYYETYTSNCDMDAMRDELNRAVADKRAVITKITCENTVAEQVAVAEPVVAYEPEIVEPVAGTACGEPFERVVNREYFVRETVQQYKPVVHYEPSGTYTTMHAVCGEFGC